MNTGNVTATGAFAPVSIYDLTPNDVSIRRFETSNDELIDE